MRHHAAIALAAAGALIATPSLAHGPRPQMLPHWGGPFGVWYGGWQAPTVIETVPPEAVPAPSNRDEWLRECRHRLGDKGMGGAVAGAAIDHAEDAPRVPDRCEAMLESWGNGPAAYGHAYGYGYGVPVMMVPVTMVPVAAPAHGPCKETVVTEEIVTSVPCRSRLIPPRAKPLPDKRVRMVPDKRVVH